MSHNFNDAAKLLGIGQKNLFALLRKSKVLNKANYPMQQFINLGYFKVSHRSFIHPVAGIKHYAKVLITDKGLAWIAKEYNLLQATDPTQRLTA